MVKNEITTKSGRMPSIFLAHGSPLTLDDQAWMKQWNSWAKTIPKPDSILMLSAHWENNPITIGATETVPLYYDFYGFPQRYYQITYPAPGAPRLAERVKKLLGNRQIKQEPNRGLDHGAYIPLMAMYPKADIPVLQLSLPSMDSNDLFELGRSLAPLRDENVLIIGSGFLTHNLRLLDWQTQSFATWTKEFDDWISNVLINQKVDNLLNYREEAPNVNIALPTHEHFVPVIVSQGTDIDDPTGVNFPIEGFVYGTFTKRSVQFG